MKPIIFFIALFYSTLSNAQLNLIIKYSYKDCIACNANLYNLNKVPKDISVKVYVSELGMNNPNQRDVLEILNSHNISYISSDSLYYSLDSSERSIIYIMKGNEVIKKDFLKNIALDKFLQVKGEIDDTGKINYPNVTSLYLTKSYYYLGSSFESFLLRINLNNLNVVSDTVWIPKNDIREKVFYRYYGLSGSDKIKQIEGLRKRIYIPKSVDLLDFIVNDKEEMLLLMSVPTVDLEDKGNGDTVVNNVFIPALVKLVKGKVNDIIVFDLDKSYQDNKGEFPKYWQAPRSILTLNNDFLGLVVPDKPQYNAPIIGRFTKGESGKLQINELIPYPIDSMYINTRIGPSMLRQIYSEPFFADAFSNIVMNLNDRSSIRLSFANSNNFTKEEVENLKIKPKHEILSLFSDTNLLRILFYDGRHLMLHNYIRIEKGYEFSHEILISYDYPNGYNLSLKCGQSGIYMYDFAKRKVRYWPYNSLN